MKIVFDSGIFTAIVFYSGNWIPQGNKGYLSSRRCKILWNRLGDESMNRTGWLINLFLIAGILVMFVASGSLREREDEIVWSRFVGTTNRDIAYDLALLNDGIVMVGWTSTRNTSDQNVMIVKFSKDGKLSWNRVVGSAGTEGGNCVEKTSDGGFIVGAISNSHDGETPAQFGAQDVWLMKYDSQGNLLWKRCYGTQAYESVFDVLEDDGYIFVGYTTSAGDEDVWLVKASKDGEVMWQRTFDGGGWDCGFAIDKAQDAYYVAGLTKSSETSVDTASTSADMWILKLSKDGELLWQRKLGGTDWDQASDILVTEDGKVVVLGTSWSKEIARHGRADFVIFVLDPDGEVILQKSYGGSQDDIAQKIARLDDGYLLVGTTWSDDVYGAKRNGGSDYLVMKMDKNGELIWSKCFGSTMDEVGYAVAVDGANYFVTGVSYSYFFGLRLRSHGGGDALLLKLRLE